MGRPRAKSAPTLADLEAAVKAGEELIKTAARAFGRDCAGATVGLDVYRMRVEQLFAAARAFVAAEESRDLELP